MVFNEVQTFIGLLISTITAAILLWSSGKTAQKQREEIQADYDRKIKESQAEQDRKVNRCYERLDQAKEHFDRKLDIEKQAHKDDVDELRRERAENYVEIKMCKLVHTNSDASFAEIKAMMNEMRIQIKEINAKIK